MKSYMISLVNRAPPADGIVVWPAVTAGEAEVALREAGLQWTYPWDAPEERHGLRLYPYTTRDRWARVGCFMSHYILWQNCSYQREPYLILEDDAEILRWPVDVDMGQYGAVSVNDPRGATRLAQVYHEKLQAREGAVVDAPWVDEPTVPQGLPGHSGYLITPEFAGEMVSKAKEVGAWPNDALMVLQFFPGRLGCATEYYTRVSGRRSTLR